MKCEKAIEMFIDQERATSLSPRLRFHLIFCLSCRKEITRLRAAFKRLCDSPFYRMEGSQAGNIMRVIKTSRISREHTVSFKQWIFTGFVILFSIFLIPFNDSIIWLRSRFGINFELPFVLIMGLVVTVYSVLFTATHMDEIKELIKTIDRKFH